MSRIASAPILALKRYEPSSLSSWYWSSVISSLNLYGVLPGSIITYDS